ncbi:MAG: glycosyltransferase [Acidimicrobiales bacterium]|nr:glycosyltransferase [Acidimicrobiales bacterium]
MRALHVVPSLDDHMGGSVHAAVALAAHLGAHDDVETELASTEQPGDDHAYLARMAPDVPVHRFPRSWPEGRFQSKGLAGWLRDSVASFDLVHLHGVFHAPALHVRRACRATGVPYVLQPHGQLDPFDLAKHRLQKQLYGPVAVRPLVAGADVVVCTTDLEAERLVTYGAGTRTAVVPLPVAPPGPGDRAGFRQRHGIPPDATVVLFLSRLDVKKGLDLLAGAMADLDAWLVVAGSGDPEVAAELDRALDGTPLGRRTVRTGFISGADKDDAFAAADVFALPSRNENFGIVVVEAMAAGLPVVVSDETYLHGEVAAAGAGAVCRVDASSCRDALAPLVADGARRAEAGRRALALADGRFAPAAATAAMVEVYRSLHTGAVA